VPISSHDRNRGDFYAEQRQEYVGKLDKMGISEDLYEGASSFDIGGNHVTTNNILRNQCASSVNANGCTCSTAFCAPLIQPEIVRTFVVRLTLQLHV
jgi:hypothetical protein